MRSCEATVLQPETAPKEKSGIPEVDKLLKCIDHRNVAHEAYYARLRVLPGLQPCHACALLVGTGTIDVCIPER